MAVMAEKRKREKRKREKRKKCTRCGGVKPLDEYAKHSGSSDGHASYCNDCRNNIRSKRHAIRPDARLRHHISTRATRQLSSIPPGFTRDLEKYLGYKLTTLIRALEEDLSERGCPSLRDCFAEGWHLDHKKPLSLFSPTVAGDSEFQDCWAIPNLWMLPAEVNLAKSDKYDGE